MWTRSVQVSESRDSQDPQNLCSVLMGILTEAGQPAAEYKTPPHLLIIFFVIEPPSASDTWYLAVSSTWLRDVAVSLSYSSTAAS